MEAYYEQQILDALGKSDYSEVVIKLLDADPSLKAKVTTIYDAAINSLKNSADKIQFDTKKINDTLTKSLTDQFNTANKSSGLLSSDLSISTILGETPKMGMISRMSFGQLRMKLLGKLKDYVDGINTNKADMIKGSIDISSIFGQTPKMGLISRLQFGELRFKLLSKLTTYTKNIDPDSLKGSIDISSIFGQTPKMGLISRLQFAELRFKLLAKLTTYVKDIKPEALQGTIDIASIFGQTPKMGLISGLQFRILRLNLLSKLNSYVKNIGADSLKGGIDIGAILGQTPKMGLLTRLRFNKLRRKLFKKIEDQIDGKEESGGVLGSIFGKAKETFNFGKKKEEVFAKEDQKVIVNDFGREAIRDLKGLLKEDKSTEPEEKKKPSWLLAILPILLGIGGLIGGILGLKTDGKWKGLLKLGSKVAIFTGLKLAAKTLSKRLGMSFLKAIPVIGTIFGIGFGISRMMQGDYVGGLIEFAGAIVDLIPVAGPFLSLGIDAYLAYRDIKGGGPKKLKDSGFNKKWVEGVTGDVWEKIPIVGEIIGVGKALGAFAAGDWRTGLFELSLSVIPGAKLILDLMDIDITKTRENISKEGLIKTLKKMGRKLSRSLVKMMVPKKLEAAALKWFGLGEADEKNDFDKVDDPKPVAEPKPSNIIDPTKASLAGSGGKGEGIKNILPKPNFNWSPDNLPKFDFGKDFLGGLKDAGIGGAEKIAENSNLYLQQMKKGIEDMTMGLRELITGTKEQTSILSTSNKQGGDNGKIPSDIQSYRTWAGDRIHEYHIDVWKAIKS